MGANILFGKRSPEYFGNPLIASYTLFKVFTIEGWHEIPDEIVSANDSKLNNGNDDYRSRVVDEVQNGRIETTLETKAVDSGSVDRLPMTNAEKFVLRGYFIFSVLIGA